MTIRPKVIALVASMLVVLGVVQIVVEHRILMPSFAELERDDARTAMRRINYALDLTLERLALSASDWATGTTPTASWLITIPITCAPT